MRRLFVALGLTAGGVLLLASSGAPLLGILISLFERGQVSTEIVKIPRAGMLLFYSLVVSLVATGFSLLMGLGPAILMGQGARSRRGAALITGLCITPLLIPPQVYAYAWGLATAPNRLLSTALPPISGLGAWGSAVRAGLVSASWLWPVVALTVAAGWRTGARSVYALAVLDTSPHRAFVRAVLPSLRAHLIAAACLVFVITLIEYPIPHLCLARTYGTELLLLMDVGAPAGQVIRAAWPAGLLVLAALLVARGAMRSMSGWGPDDEDAILSAAARGRSIELIVVSGLIWVATVVVPIGVLIGSFRAARAWREAFTLFAREWATSVSASLAAGALGVVIAATTVVWAAAHRPQVRKIVHQGAILSAIGAVIPAAVLGVGFVTTYNRQGWIGDLYSDSPVVWVFALTARYGAIPILLVWLALRKRSIITVEQARVDGAGHAALLTSILLPMAAPSLLAGGAIVALLSMSEVVVSQLVGPVGYPSIALAILNLMHYGRDDTVIVASLLIVTSGMILAQVSARLWLRRA
jgi:iron(III) transport system permease protein